MKKKPMKTAAELMSSLRSDPKWVAQHEDRQRNMHQRMLEDRRAEEPLLDELRAAGIVVTSVWDLVNTKAPYPAALPILLKRLGQGYPSRVREGIARALAVPEAHAGWSVLLDAFRQEQDATTQGVKWALACALGASGTDAELKDVIQLLRDRSLGRNRVPLLQVLGRSRDSAAREVLEELRTDGSIAEDVRKALRQRQRDSLGRGRAR
jgi:HEAT repeat protein